MAQLIVLVLNNIDQCPAVLEAWNEAGAPGATILDSTGPGRLRNAGRDDLPLIPSLRDLLGSTELHHRTLFTLVEDEQTTRRVVEATREIVGDFDRPHTGLLFAVTVDFAFGLRKSYQEGG